MLEFKNVSYAVNGAAILSEASVNIPDGRLVAVTGPNGGGKTTFAKLIAGLIRPTGGTITYNGIDITDMSITERAKLGIGYAFQQPVRFKGITVRKLMNIAGGGADEKYVSDVLRSVGIDPVKYLDREIDASLSGGEIKRIEIASVLIRKAECMVFDEPEAGIDLWSFNSLSDVFSSLRGGASTTIIISHQEKILAAVDDIMIIRGGKIAGYGDRDRVMSKISCDFSNCSCGDCGCKGCNIQVDENE